VRLVLQAQAAECGLACLAMVADHHGHRTDLAELRQRFGLSLKGVNLARLVDIACGLGLQARPLRVELEELDKLQLPCLLHWDLNHFVVLEKVGRRELVLLDPAFGLRRMTRAACSRHFTGVVLELTPGADFRTCPPPPAIRLRQLTGPVRGLAHGLALVLALSLALQLFVVLAPFFLQWVIDHALVSVDHDLLLLLALGFGLLLALQIGTALLRGWAVLHLASRLGLQWAGNVFAHVLRLPMAYFERRQLGDVVSRLGSVQAIQRTLTVSAVEAVVDGAMAVATLAMMLLYSPLLATVSLVAVAVYLSARALAYGAFRRATECHLVAGARQQGHLLESLRGMQSLKVAGQEGHRQGAYANLLADTVGSELRLGRLGLGFATGSQAVFGVERLLVIWLAAGLVLEGRFSVGMLVAYLAYKDQFAARIAGLIDKWVEFRMLRLHGERLADVVLAEPETERAKWLPEPDVVNGESGLVVDGLGFRYAEGEPEVLRECSFRIAPGESVAIVGPSGCGKTTLLKLLLGLLQPTAGSIRVDGLPLHRIGLGEYRASVGAVMQDDQLFAGSLADNIAMGDPEPDPERIEVASRQAAVHEEIMAMPMRYHTLVGDMGSSLSGGQRQRVILARALYRRPRFLFLDEATSHLDVATEQQVNEAIRALRITRVIIAHRPETIASADRVLAMQQGRLVSDAGQAPAADSGRSMLRVPRGPVAAPPEVSS
jgi:ATP-binding cassette subfamily B protein RaxB